MDDYKKTITFRFFFFYKKITTALFQLTLSSEPIMEKYTLTLPIISFHFFIFFFCRDKKEKKVKKIKTAFIRRKKIVYIYL